MHSTNKVLLFVVAMTTIVSLALALLFYGLQDRVKINEEVYNKKQTLSAIQSKLDKNLDEMTSEEILNIFNSQVTQKVINSNGVVMKVDQVEALGYGGSTADKVDMSKEKKKALEDRAWPFYEFTNNDGKKYYIISARGNGLWDEIWGYIALEDDFKTIAGASFDHKAETPGLGAEIKDNKAFQKQFIGTQIMSEDGNYQGVYVNKQGAKNKKYEVDGITGATITADGVTEMITAAVKGYAPYLKTLN